MTENQKMIMSDSQSKSNQNSSSLESYQSRPENFSRGRKKVSSSESGDKVTISSRASANAPRRKVISRKSKAVKIIGGGTRQSPS